VKRFLSKQALAILFVTASVAAALCRSGGWASSSAEPVHDPPGDFVRSSHVRSEVRSVPEETLRDVARDNLSFALDVMRASKPKGNFFFSPHGLTMTLAMAYGGARGNTRDQMRHALHFTLPDDRLHQAIDALDQTAAPYIQVPPDAGAGRFCLRSVHAVWASKGRTFRGSYIDLLATNYGAGLRVLDFATKPDESRQAINRWVGDETEQRIPELLGPGTIERDTALVLTNAIYFLAPWAHPFGSGNTRSGPFRRPDRSTSTARFMHEMETHGMTKGTDYQAVELDYIGGQESMFVVMPREGTLDSFVASLDAQRIERMLGGLSTKMVALALPRFTVRSNLSGMDALENLGMTDAFDSNADFSGMDGTRGVAIRDVVQQASVSVDERGTEAAAATGVVMQVGLPEHETLTIDGPFLFLIRDKATSAVLFLGLVVDAGA
jgi:serpin B